MCISNRQLDLKSRRLMIVANLAFICAILLWNSDRWNWVRGISQMELNWLHALTGFLFGLYIAIMLFGVRGVRRCGLTDSAK